MDRQWSAAIGASMVLMVGCTGPAENGPHTAASASRPAPPMADLASPGRPGWVVDEASGCWFWDASPKHGAVVTWTVLAPRSASGTCPGGPATGRGRAEWRWLEDGKPRQSLAYGLFENGRLNG